MKNFNKFLIVLISLAFIASGALAQTDASPKIKTQLEKQVKPPSPALNQPVSAATVGAPTNDELIQMRQITDLPLPAYTKKTGGGNGPTDSFCAPTYAYGCQYGDGFTDFAVEQIQNLGSGCANLNGLGWSEYYSLGPAILFPGLVHTFSMSVGYANQHVNIWIDFNDDLTLTSDEMILSDYIVATTGTIYDVDVTIPVNATPGPHAMRAMCVWITTFTDPCGSYNYGEAEDYSVIIGAAEYGDLEGYVTENTGGSPIAGAAISVSNGAYTTTSAADGFYSFTDILAGTWSISCTKTGYNPINSTVTVTVGQTTTKNFAMTAPTMDITPAAINVIVDPFGTATEYLTIDNNGDGTLGWNASIEYLTKDNSIAKLPKGSQAYAVKVYPTPAEVVSFDTDDPGTFTTIVGTALDPFAGDFGIASNSLLYVITYTAPSKLYSFDINTGAETLIANVTGMTGGQTVSGMACDKSTGIMYVSTTDISASDIYTVDLTTGALTLIGTTGIPGIIEIAIDGTGTMYAWDIVNDEAFTVDKATGVSTLLGPLGYDLNYAQGGNWDPESDQIYLAAYTFAGQLMTMDKTTGALTLIGDFPGGAEVDCLAFPGAAENWLSISPSNGTINAGGTFQMTVNFDALDIVAGTVKTANINFTSNPQVGTVTIPVSMTVGSLQFGHITGTVNLGGSLPYNIGNITDVLVTAGPYSIHPDASGFYDLPVYPGTYSVEATLYGYQTQTIPGVVVGEGATVSNQNMTMPCLYGIVTGTVTSVTTGLPIPNATVKLVGTTFQDITGPDGVYEIIVEAGSYNVKVNVVGYASQTVAATIIAESTITVDFNLADLEGIIVVIDLDPTPNGQALADVIQDFFPGGLVEYTTDINGIPLTEEVQSVFLLLGIYANNFTLTEAEATVITTWINAYSDRNLYMEGGDTWAFDTPTSLHTYFNITGVADGGADLTQVDGIGSYWSGNSWSYSGENNWIDHLDAIAPAINVMVNPADGANCGVAYDAGTYRTVGASFEITGMTGGPGFNIGVACVMAWFGYPVFTYGELEGYVTELAGGAPIADATITVGGIANATTGADGYYFIDQVLTGTWDVSCTKEGYNPASATVTIVEDVTTTQNFQLTEPQMVVNPLSVSVELEPNAFTDETVNISNPGNGTVDWSAGITVIGDGGGSDALFDLQFDWPVGNASGEAGIETDGSYVYTTLWNGTQFCKYDLTGAYLGTFSCGSAGAIRDLAYDGTYFYGGAASTTVYEMDFTNQVVVSTINAPIAVRAIAYDEDLDVFYANNWSEDITMFNAAGANLGSFPVGPVGLDYYGFDYDKYSAGGPFLWGYAQTGNTLNELVQIQLPSGVETGVTFDVGTVAAVGTGIAGGLAIADCFVPGFYTLLGTAQNVDIWGLELCESGPVWLTIEPNSGSLTGGQNEDMILHFNAMDLLPGFYYAEIHFSTDPNVGSPVVDVTLHVEGLIPAINLNLDFDCTDVILEWEMPAGGTADSWNVYKDGSLIGNSTVMTYTDEMVDPEVEYSYYVKAVYGGVESMPTSTETITVPVPADLEAIGLEATANVPNENDVTLNWDAPDACLAPDGYDIYRDGSQINTSLVTALTYVDAALEIGLYEYYVVAVYYFGESDPSDPVYTLITGIEDVNSDIFRIYPNPVSSMIYIESTIGMTGIQVINNAGQIVLDKIVDVNQYKIDVAKYEKGVYYIKIETADGSKLRKITVN